MLTTRQLFERFTQSAKGRNVGEVIQLAEGERYPYAVVGKTMEARRPKVEYEALLGGLLFFLRAGMQPVGVDVADFQLYRPLCEDLVRNGHVAPDVLGMFSRHSA